MMIALPPKLVLFIGLQHFSSRSQNKYNIVACHAALNVPQER